MTIVLVDGKGKGNTAEVNSANRLVVQSVTRTEAYQRAVDGQILRIHSDIVALTTTGSFNAVLYIKNTGQTDLNIFSFNFGNTVLAQWQIYLNATGGTIISDASAVTPVNADMGSTGAIIAQVFKATGDAKTATGGTTIGSYIEPVGGSEHDSLLILPPNGSLTFMCKPSAAASVAFSMRVAQLDLSIA